MLLVYREVSPHLNKLNHCGSICMLLLGMEVSYKKVHGSFRGWGCIFASHSYLIPLEIENIRRLSVCIFSLIKLTAIIHYGVRMHSPLLGLFSLGRTLPLLIKLPLNNLISNYIPLCENLWMKQWRGWV